MTHPLKIIATFHPQAWVNGYSVEADPEGPCEFDVTNQVLALPLGEVLVMGDDDDASDNLRRGDDVPEWIRDWSGPFWVEVYASIQAYLEANLTL